jgi:competence protein ComEA
MKPIRSILLAAMLAGLSFGAHADKININEADAASLAALNGIGQSKAEAIIEYRKVHGPFRSLEALTEVRGISPGLIDRNRDRMTIGNAAPDAPRAAPD